jgi:hypothetical protein
MAVGKSEQGRGAGDKDVALPRQPLSGRSADAKEEWHVHNSLAGPLVQLLNEQGLGKAAAVMAAATEPGAELSEPSAFAAMIAEAVAEAVETEVEEPEGTEPAGTENEVDPGETAAEDSGLATRASDGKSWRLSRMPIEITGRARQALDRAIDIGRALAKTDSKQSRGDRLKSVGAGLRADGFADFVTTEGFLKVPVRAARTGVQAYSDGLTTWGEYRSEVEVGSDKSLASWALKPFTNDHPPDLVIPLNAVEFARGAVGQDATLELTSVDGNRYVLVTICVWDLDALIAIREGKVELSAGYLTTIVAERGTDRLGNSYEFLQTDIEINHLALVDRGRAGPMARIKVDAAWEVQPVTTEDTMEKHTDVEVMPGLKVSMTVDQAEKWTKAQADKAEAEAKVQADAAAAKAVEDAKVQAAASEAKLAKDAADKAEADAAAAKLDALEKLEIKVADQASALRALERQAVDQSTQLDASKRSELAARIAPVCPGLKWDGTETPLAMMSRALVDMAPEYAADVASAAENFGPTGGPVFITRSFDRELAGAAKRKAAGDKGSGEQPQNVVSINDAINREFYGVKANG